MTALSRLAVAAAVLLAGCTEPSPAPLPEEPPGSADAQLVVSVIASTSGPSSETDATYLTGLELAVVEINADGGVDGARLVLRVHDDDGDPKRVRPLLAEALGSEPLAMLVVGPAQAVAEARADVQAAGTPVVLLGGDLYTTRRLYREVFMTGVPLLWQARVLARYLVVDRRAERIVAVIEPGPAGRSQRRAIVEGLAEERATPDAVLPLAEGLPRQARRADAVLFLGSAGGARTLAERLDGDPRLALSSEALSPGVGEGVPPGTVAPYPYTWAGWAEPIGRVAAFRELLGEQPAGFAQEGYDAIRALAAAAADGARGRRLVTALERSPTGMVFSSLPVRLGPDDHMFIDDSQLGLFTAAGPGEEAEPWVVDPPRWRPLMRTFTYDGERTVVLDGDKRVFFPTWRQPRPSPKYRRSRYGITSGPSDPLH